MEEVVELFWDAQSEMYYTPAYGGIYFDYYGKYGPAGELYIVVLNLWTVNGELPPPPPRPEYRPIDPNKSIASIQGHHRLASLKYPRTTTGNRNTNSVAPPPPPPGVTNNTRATVVTYTGTGAPPAATVSKMTTRPDGMRGGFVLNKKY